MLDIKLDFQNLRQSCGFTLFDIKLLPDVGRRFWEQAPVELECTEVNLGILTNIWVQSAYCRDNANSSNINH